MPHKQGVIIFIVIVAIDRAETLLPTPCVPLARTPAYGCCASVSSAVKRGVIMPPTSQAVVRNW